MLQECLGHSLHPNVSKLRRRAILLQHGIMNHGNRHERTEGRDRRARRVGRNVWWGLCTDGHDVWGAQPAIDMSLHLRLAMGALAMAAQVMLQAIEVGFVDKHERTVAGIQPLMALHRQLQTFISVLLSPSH